MKIGTQTKKHVLSSKSTKAKVQAIFKMAAAAISGIHVRAMEYEITTQF
jgi:hypothetical protein